MSIILEADETGDLRVPATLFPHAAPRGRYVVEAEGGRVVISEVPTTKTTLALADFEARSADILRWAASHKGGPGLPAEAVGRDAIYD